MSRPSRRWPQASALGWVIATALALGRAPAAEAAPPEEVSFRTPDGQTIHGDLYSGGSHAVVLAHGGVFDKESWSVQAEALVEAGFTALAFDFRGYGGTEPTYGLPGKRNDVLGAIDYLVAEDFKRISVVGGSMGAQAAMAAAAETDRIDRIVLLAPGSSGLGAGLRAGRSLFIISQGDRLRQKAEQEYRDAPEPKRLELLPGSAHAQHLFKTEQAEMLTQLIIDFLIAE